MMLGRPNQSAADDCSKRGDVSGPPKIIKGIGWFSRQERQSHLSNLVVVAERAEFDRTFLTEGAHSEW